MATSRPERYTKSKCKGYLTYPASPVVNGLFLNEGYATKYEITIENKTMSATNITPVLKAELEKIGAKLVSKRILHTTGKRRVFGIPVQIRKTKENKKLVSITIRVDGDVIGEVDDKLQKIEAETLEFIKYKPKKCMWDKLTPDKISITEPTVEQGSDILKDESITLAEFKKLQNKVDDLHDDVQTIHRSKIIKSVHEDRKVLNDILK